MTYSSINTHNTNTSFVAISLIDIEAAENETEQLARAGAIGIGAVVPPNPRGGRPKGTTKAAKKKKIDDKNRALDFAVQRYHECGL